MNLKFAVCTKVI